MDSSTLPLEFSFSETRHKARSLFWLNEVNATVAKPDAAYFSGVVAAEVSGLRLGDS